MAFDTRIGPGDGSSVLRDLLLMAARYGVEEMFVSVHDMHEPNGVGFHDPRGGRHFIRFSPNISLYEFITGRKP